MDYEYVERNTTPAEYNMLRGLVGWGTYEESVIEKGLAESLYCLCDGALVFYIQDIIVLPDHQGKGLGQGIMERVMAFINGRASKNTIIGLMAAKGKEEFYHKFGFSSRPSDKHGCGMTQFVGRVEA